MYNFDFIPFFIASASFLIFHSYPLSIPLKPFFVNLHKATLAPHLLNIIKLYILALHTIKKYVTMI